MFYKTYITFICSDKNLILFLKLKSMKPSIDELKNEIGYKLIKSVPFENLVPFIFDNMKPNTKTMVFFYFFLSICGVSVSIFLMHPGYTFGQLFWYGFAGFISSFTIFVPIHELLHGFALKMYGAKGLKYGKDLKQMMFYVTVNDFIMNRKEFSVMALMPFAVITLGLLILEWILPDQFIWFFLSAIFWHATMCIGDFSMLAFYERNKHLEMYTFDDADKKITYYYSKLS